jgi:hypothetical protein
LDQQLKALPLPGLRFCPGGQNLGLFAPWRAAVGDLSAVPVALGLEGPLVAAIAAEFCVAAPPSVMAAAAMIARPGSLSMANSSGCDASAPTR